MKRSCIQRNPANRKTSYVENIDSEIKLKPTVNVKKPVKVKMSRMEKWAQKMKDVDNTESAPKFNENTEENKQIINKYASPLVSKLMKCLNCGLVNCNCPSKGSNTIK